MANVIQYAPIFQKELDKTMIEQSTTGWMEQNASLLKYDGGKEVKIPVLDMDGLGDYTDGFAEGSVSLTYETKTMSMSRGRQFVIPERDVDDSGFLLTASNIMGEFQRTKVIPEVDAYRYSSIASQVIAGGNATGGYTPSESDILKKLYYDIAAVQDVVGDVPLVITMSSMVAAILDTSNQISKKLDVVDFKQGGITLKVTSLNGEHPIIRAGSGRLKTAYTFFDGRTAGDGNAPNQVVGGFKPTAEAKDINWIICPKTAPKAVSKTDKMRIFDPETYQKSRSWAMDYIKYHDLWLTEANIKAMRVSVKQSL